MAEASNLSSRLGVKGGVLDPLITLAKAQAERAPGLALQQLHRVIGASAESAKVEAERLKARHGEGDPRWRAREQQGAQAAALLDLIERAQKAVEAGETLKPMTVKGQVRIAEGQQGLAVEVAEDVDAGWVVVRGLADPKGIFVLEMEAPASAYGAGEVLNYVVIARDAPGKELGRSDAFPFKSGAAITVGVAPGGKPTKPAPGRPDKSQAGTKPAPPKAPG